MVEVASFTSPRETLVVDGIDLADTIIEKILNDDDSPVTVKVNEAVEVWAEEHAKLDEFRHTGWGN